MLYSALDMRYGIVVCPKCRNAKLVDLKYNTTKCNRCNKILKLNNLVILYKSNSQSAIRAKIGEINRENL